MKQPLNMFEIPFTATYADAKTGGEFKGHRHHQAKLYNHSAGPLNLLVIKSAIVYSRHPRVIVNDTGE